jgi:hypothetical protein
MDEDDQGYTPSGTVMKRRRTVAPSLEGKSRGWNPRSSSSTGSSSRSPRYSIGEDEEDYDVSEGTEERIHDRDVDGEEWKTKAGEYRDANTLLHDLHAQNRQRVHPPSIHNYQQQQLLPLPTVGENDFIPPSREWDDSDTTKTPDFESRLVRERYEERNKLVSVIDLLLFIVEIIVQIVRLSFLEQKTRLG